MILGTGIDAVNIDRVKKLQGRVLEKLFHPEELEQYHALETAHEDVRAQFLASRFAVKEAYAKARGTGFSSVVVPSEIITRKEEDAVTALRVIRITALCTLGGGLKTEGSTVKRYSTLYHA